MSRCDYCFKEITSQQGHVECFIQFHMRFHNKSREQVIEIFSHILGHQEELSKLVRYQPSNVNLR